MSIFRLGDQKPPEPQRITDAVVMRFEHVYEVDPALMELTGQQDMPGMGHEAHRRQPLGPPGLDARPLRRRGAARRRGVRDDAGGPPGRPGVGSQRTEERRPDGQRDALELLHAPGLSARRVDRHDQDGRRAGVLRGLLGRRDLAQGPLGPVRGGRRQDRAHPLRPERHPRLPARADADLPAGRDARRAHRRADRARRVDRATSGCCPSTGSTGRARSPCRGSRRPST